MKLTRYIESIFRKSNKTSHHWKIYVYFVVIRIVLVLIPQNGYIHPDEFFQSVEVLAGDEFEIEHVRTWEFNSSYPLRSIAVNYFLLKVPLSILDFVSIYTKHFLHLDLRNSYMFLVYPRLIMCALSFVNDWSLYKICKSYSLRPDIRMLALASSYVILIFGTRTFSNTVEMAISSVLLYFVADCMIQSNTIIYKSEFLQDKYRTANSIGEKVKLYKLKAALPSHSYNKVLIMATLCVIGIFNRPTFLIFGSPLVFFWLLRGMGSKSISFTDFNLRITFFTFCALPSILIFTLIDSLYYSYLTSGEIFMFDIGLNNFVFTPWNFIKYNINPEKTAAHGVHPKYLHLLVNIPLLYNVLGVAAIFSFGLLVYRFLKADYKYLPRSQSIIGLMSSSVFAPLGILSLINHQEARFLLPFTLPIILLHSPKLITGFCTSYPFTKENKYLRYMYHKFLCNRRTTGYLFKTWFGVNISLSIFYGFIHQGGVIKLGNHFSGVMKSKPMDIQVHLVTSHIYNLPVSLINIPSSNILYTNRETKQKYRRSKEFFLYEYGSTEIDVLLRKTKLILDNCEVKRGNNKRRYHLYLALPSSLHLEFLEGFYRQNSTYLKFEKVRTFYLHFSAEALPNLMSAEFKRNVLEGNIIGVLSSIILSVSSLVDTVSSVVNQFGLVLYRLEVQTRH